MTRSLKQTTAALLIVIYLSACASNSRSIQNSSPQSSYSMEEVMLGKQIHEYIISKMPACENPQVLTYIQGVGKKLAKFAKRQDLPYQFIVLQDERIYATSSPGGFVYLTTGAILFAQNEAELAAILAHEIGELQFKDPRFSHTKSLMKKVITGGAVVAPIFGSIGALALIGLVGAYTYMDRGNIQEEHLYKSDKIALKLLHDAEEDPQGLVDFLRRLLNATPKELMYLYDYYQTRPVSEARLTKLEQAFSALPFGERSFNTNRNDFLKITEPLRLTPA